MSKKYKNHYNREERERWAFSRGWRLIAKEDKPNAKEELKKALGIREDATFYQRKNARRIPDAIEVEKIVAIMKKYGVPHDKVFGTQID